MGLMQAELATASGLIQAGAAQTYSAAVNWKCVSSKTEWIALLCGVDYGEHAPKSMIQKKEIRELVQPHLKTDVSCTAMLGEHVMRTSVGSVEYPSLQNANIS
ncbi:hypothetical protein P8452_30690 [Trifolium repens]|nr:aminoacyl tRNA synthase complex-interacting multifunctional protein [Trifolium repens]WJX43619.1 hypothetical protein P8452_30690 [Trifolium repens]